MAEVTLIFIFTTATLTFFHCPTSITINNYSLSWKIYIICDKNNSIHLIGKKLLVLKNANQGRAVLKLELFLLCYDY